MTITVYQPAITVTLTKLVARKDGVAQRYAGADRERDLTPFLGERGAVRTIKNIYDAAGGFSIAFPDQVDQQTGDSLYALVEPMDMIEIRMARQPENYVGQPFPLVMRGFVSTVQRVESFNQDGTPERLVVIQGQDFGKLWHIHAIWFEVAVLTDNAMLDEFALQAALGIVPRLYTLADFVTTLTTKVLNSKVDAMSAFAKLPANKQIQPFQVSATVQQGQIIPQMLTNFRGPLWGLLELAAERPWNELFLDYDDAENPLLVFRPAPFKDLDGNLILADAGAVDPGTFNLDIEAVTSLEVNRSDARVANFFWVPPGPGQLDTQQMLNVATLLSGAQLDFNYPNNAPALYGQRRMEIATNVVPTSLTDLPTKLPPGQRVQAQQAYIAWNIARMQQLKAMNRDNAVLENGTAVVRGDETLRPGRYLRLTRGALVSKSYVVQVSHLFAPFQTWTTTLALERGNGFLARDKYPGSPFWAEGRRGPYTN